MNTEEFEAVLRQKYNQGVHKFTGKRTHNVYELRNPTNKVRGWSVFVNGTCVLSRTSFFAIAYEIYDKEVIRPSKSS